MRIRNLCWRPLNGSGFCLHRSKHILVGEKHAATLCLADQIDSRGGRGAGALRAALPPAEPRRGGLRSDEEVAQALAFVCGDAEVGHRRRNPAGVAFHNWRRLR